MWASRARWLSCKMTTVAKERTGERIGQLDDADLTKLNQAIIVFLGLA
jgi:mRNA interferase MazF